MKESKYVKTKIVAGYVLLLAVCLVAIGYVYRIVVRPAADEDYYAALRSKRDVAAQTLYHLYQAEGYAQLMTAGYKSYEARYRGELRTVRNFLDSLRRLERDSLQMQRLDSISMLVADKERRTLNLLHSLRSGGTAGLLSKNIEQLIKPHDSIPRVEKPVVEEHFDTVKVKRARRGFFRRIADVFKPPKEDSSVVISKTRTIATDSIPATVVADTIASVLRNLQDKVTGERIEIYDRAWNEGLRLSYSNRLVNSQIYRLLSDFQREDDTFILRRIEENDRLKHRSSVTLGWIAGGAVVLMLLFVAILWRDINRSNRYKRQLELANREKQALLDAREKLMLAITHDIKAPLGSMMGYMDLLSRIAHDKRQALYLQNMKQTADHLLGLVHSLLDFYKLDMNKVEPACVAFVPAQLFENIRAGFEPVAAERGIALELTVGEGARREVVGDPSRIRQIVENLVSNAIKFTDHGAVTLAVTRDAGGLLVCEVRDTGRGIGREERERIFCEFVRLRSAQGVEGVGLGLSIVDRLVRLLGGRIWLDSTPGKGSRFVVEIPVAEAADRAEEDDGTEVRAGEAVAKVGGMRLLVVDDDPLQLEMTAALCRAEGVEAECCQYPEFAVKIVQERAFDAVLTDIQMPAMDGVQLCAALARVAPEVPVIAVSARSEELPEGFAAVLRKPFAASELMGVLAAVRENHKGTVCGGGEGVQDAAADGFGALTAFAAGDPEAERNILEAFVEQNESAAAQMAEALGRRDRAQLAALAHRMAPIFTMIGQAHLAELLRAIEHGDERSDGELAGWVDEAVERVRAIVAEAKNKLSL